MTSPLAYPSNSPYSPNTTVDPSLVAILPVISVGKTQSGGVASVTITVVDKQGRVQKVEFQTQIGSGSPSAWTEDTSVPYSTTVAYDATALSVIRWRVIGFDANDHADQVLFQGEEHFPTGQHTGPYSITREIGDGAGVLPTGIWGDVHITIPGTLAAITLLGNESGSVSLDLWKCTYAQYDNSTHPVVGDSMVGGGSAPAIVTAHKNQITTFAGWASTTFAYNEVVRLYVTSATSIKRLLVDIEVNRS